MKQSERRPSGDRKNTDRREGPIWRSSTNMRLPLTLDGPLKISFSPYSGELIVDALEPHHHVKGGARWILSFSPNATRELIEELLDLEIGTARTKGSTDQQRNRP